MLRKDEARLAALPALQLCPPYLLACRPERAFSSLCLFRLLGKVSTTRIVKITP